MNEPTLVILAAGMGRRFGGLKQITPVDEFGHAIIDFSMYDAYKAGFRKLVFIIKHEIEEDFKSFIGSRAEKYFDVKYIFQQLDKLPEGYVVPEGRTKPWGTGHAIICASEVLDGPFAVINSDDYYGQSTYEELYRFLSSDRAENEHCMIPYLLRKTVTENGSVARGICQVENGLLTDVVERTNIEKRGEDAAYTTDGGETWIPLSGDTLVSMNCWGYNLGIIDGLKDRFPAWLDENLKTNPLRCEYYLPNVTGELIKDGTGTVCAIPSREKWYGITYKDDMPSVVSAIARMRAEGKYPEKMMD